MPKIALEDDRLKPRLVLDKQLRSLGTAVRRGEPLAYSAISLVEIAGLVSEGKLKLKVELGEFFASLRSNPMFCLLPISHDIAADVGLLRILQDPADRTIAATAGVHALRLVTSDTRIIDSRIVPVIE